MRWHGSASGKRGRTQKYSEAAIQFYLTIKTIASVSGDRRLRPWPCRHSVQGWDHCVLS